MKRSANKCMQSASYSSTAGALHTPSAAGPSYGAGRGSDGGMEQQRPAASPLSTSSSATSHGHAYAPNMPNTYSTQPVASAGLGIGLSAPPDLRLTVPSVPVTTTNQTTSWHTPSANYSNDLSGTGRGNWEFGGGYMGPSPATGLPSSAQSYNYAPPRVPSLTGQPPTMPNDGRFVPLQDYGPHSHQTSNA